MYEFKLISCSLMKLLYVLCIQVRTTGIPGTINTVELYPIQYPTVLLLCCTSTPMGSRIDRMFFTDYLLDHCRLLSMLHATPVATTHGMTFVPVGRSRDGPRSFPPFLMQRRQCQEVTSSHPTLIARSVLAIRFVIPKHINIEREVYNETYRILVVPYLPQ